MKVKTVKVDSINLYGENPREIEKEQYQKLKDSIKEFGLVKPLVVNLRNHDDFKDMERKPIIVGGNMRYRACQDLGYEEIPIVEIDVDRQRERVLNIALNRISGKWDVSKLEKMIYELTSEDLEVDLDLTGLDDWELKLYNPGVQDDNDFEEIIDKFEEKRSSAKNENWFYIEYYEDGEKYNKLVELLTEAEHMETAKHDINSDFFYKVIKEALTDGE